MLPFAIPASTNAERLFREILPRAHAELVPASVAAPPLHLGIHVAGNDAEASFELTYAITGARIAIRDGDSPKLHMWIGTSADAVAELVADVNGAARLVPKFPPVSDVVLFTDPRMLKRLTLVSGSVELAVPDFNGVRLAARFAAGDAAARASYKLIEDPADVTIEATTSTLERLLAGQIAPDVALADRGVTIHGKKLVAMQLGLALAPFFPTPKR